MSVPKYSLSRWVWLVPFLTVLVMWVVYWTEIQFQVNLNSWGIYPRKLSGLWGIVLSPFLHGSVEHLYNNTIPIALLLAALFYFYREVALQVLVWGVLALGFCTWVIARPSYHIGMSGVIYLLASYLFFKGIFTKNLRQMAVSMIVVFIYGSMVWYIFPVEEGISWEGHLSGFVVGMALAWFIGGKYQKTPKYDWEREDYDESQDAFLQHFDEEGNFIEPQENEITELPSEYTVKYHYRKENPNSPPD